MSAPGGLHTIEVQTFGSDHHAAVVLPSSCTCKDALPMIAKRLDMKPESMQLFGLFSGKLGTPEKILQDTDTVPMATQLSLQRWSTQVDSEEKLVKHDDTAIHLLYCEAKYNLDIGNIHPSDEQRQELDGFSDPFFPTERQFLQVARKVDGYSSYVTQQVTVSGDIESNEACIPSGTLVKVVMNLEGLYLKAGGLNKVLLHWPWNIVKRWKRQGPPSNFIMFEVCLPQMNAGILTWIKLQTTQAHYLFQTAGFVCAEVKRLQDLSGQGPAEGNSKMAGKFVDPLKEFVNNALFSETRFSKFK